VIRLLRQLSEKAPPTFAPLPQIKAAAFWADMPRRDQHNSRRPQRGQTRTTHSSPP